MSGQQCFHCKGDLLGPGASITLTIRHVTTETITVEGSGLLVRRQTWSLAPQPSFQFLHSLLTWLSKHLLSVY